MESKTETILHAEALRREAVGFLDSIRDYERESGNQICYDERTSDDLYDLYLKIKADEARKKKTEKNQNQS